MPILQIVQTLVAKEEQIKADWEKQRVHTPITMLHCLIEKNNNGVSVCAHPCSLLGSNPHWSHVLKIKSWHYTDAWKSFYTNLSYTVSMLWRE